jgi:alpha-beta hydrolase superfamily lysophospholipase
VATNGSVHEGELEVSDGLRLHYRERRVSGAMAHIVLVHGVAEHGGRYQGFLDFFAGHGIDVSVMDLRGHGLSAGRRVWVPAFESYLEDLELFLAHVVSPGRPVFLVGHSLGGLIAVRFAETRHAPLRGLVVSGAALRPAIVPPAPATWLLQQVNRLSSATRVPRLVKAGQLSRDPAVVRQYEADPLVPRHLTTGLGVAALEAGRLALAEADRIVAPTLVLHGGADAVVDPRGSEELLARLRVADKDLRAYPGLFHEIFNEPEREEVLNDLFRWIQARAAACGGPDGGSTPVTPGR